MKLDEALQHRWAGRDIKRPHWSWSLTEKIGCRTHPYRLTNEDIDADDWEVVPKYVRWDEAWKATKQGKAFIADYYNIQGSRMERKEFRLNNTTHVIEYRQNEHHCWRTYDSSVPLHWLDATNFEIVED